MALYKIVPKNPYYFWSVMSLIMQVSMAFRMGLKFVLIFVYSYCPCLLNTLCNILQHVSKGVYILPVDFLSWGVLVFIPYDLVFWFICVAQNVFPLNLKSTTELFDQV